MSINFQCPFCGQKLEAAEDWVGSQTQCPSCQHDITIIQQQDQPNMNSKDMNDEEHTKNLRDDKTVEKKLQDGKEQITSQNIQNRETESTPQKTFSTSLITGKNIVYGICLFVVIMIILVDGQSIKAIASKVNDTIDISCYFYSTLNEKVIPYCEVSLYTSSSQDSINFERVFANYYNAEKDSKIFDKKVKEMEYKKDVSYSEKILALVDAVLVAERNYVTTKACIEAKKHLRACRKDFFRKGKFTWSKVPNGEYILCAYAMYGTQHFIWVKHIKMEGMKVEILLTNDESCNIIDDRSIILDFP